MPSFPNHLGGFVCALCVADDSGIAPFLCYFATKQKENRPDFYGTIGSSAAVTVRLLFLLRPGVDRVVA